MDITPLKAFIAPVPVCFQTATIADALEKFCHSQGERLVVLNEDRQPVGLVTLDKLMPYSISSQSGSPDRPGHQLISQTIPRVIEPIATIPADLSWGQYQSECNFHTGNSPYALVEKAGTFLGLLDNKKLLRYLIGNELPQTATVELRTTLNSQLYTYPEIGKKTSSQMEKQGMALHSLAKLLESLPLPLILLFATGEIAHRNSAWQHAVGAFPTPKASKQAVAAFLESLPVGDTSDRSSVSIEIETSSYDTQGLEAPPESWQFVKIPLGNASKQATSQELPLWERAIFTPPVPRMETSQQSGVSLERRSQAVEDRALWLVLATKMTLGELEVKELAAKNADLQQRDRQKNEFLASIGHELKTPLTALLGLSSLLKNNLRNSASERQAHYARLIHHSGRQMMLTLNDLLDLCRIETEQLELMLEPVEIATICDRAYEQVKQSLADRLTDAAVPETQFILKIAPGIEAIAADELRLRQILVNLLSNALKFTEPTAEVGLEVTQWSHKWIGFTVWDTGIGIKASHQTSIFEKFQKVENPRKQHLQSTGLGLILTQHLAQLHGGDVTFISLEGQGSQFTLLLPAPEKQDNYDKFPISYYQLLAANSLVLIVETDPQQIWDLTKLLKAKGYHCAVARSTADALQKAERLQPRAILINTAPISNCSAREILTQLKSETATRHIKAIALTQDSTESSAVLELADGFLSLPIDNQALELQLGYPTSTPPASKPRPDPLPRLTILCLSPGDRQALQPTETQTFNLDIGNLCTGELNALLGQEHRIVEASDLDQAELLAKIWKPNVVLLNDSQLLDPLVFLQELSEYEVLASLPLVTLTPETTQAANQLMHCEMPNDDEDRGLSVFPCLVTPSSLPESSTLLQVLQVAAGFGNNTKS